jgi:hypothetical protein
VPNKIVTSCLFPSDSRASHAVRDMRHAIPMRRHGGALALTGVAPVRRTWPSCLRARTFYALGTPVTGQDARTAVASNALLRDHSRGGWATLPVPLAAARALNGALAGASGFRMAGATRTQPGAAVLHDRPEVGPTRDGAQPLQRQDCRCHMLTGQETGATREDTAGGGCAT